MNILNFDLNIYTVLLIVAGAWHYALRCGFVSDDHAVIAARKDIIPDTEKNPTKESYWLKVFNDGIVMYYINAIMFRLGTRRVPFLWHLLSLCLHLANTYLLYLIITPVVGSSVAVVACLVWGINPMLNQNVAWVSGRPYLIGTFLMFMGMLFWRNPFIFIPLYGLAVITNISIGLVPILIKLMYPEAWQGTAYIIAMFACGLPFIIWKFKKRFTGGLVIDRENFKFKKRRIFCVARIYGYYIWSIIVPVRMGWYHQAGFRYNRAWEKVNIWTIVSMTMIGYIARQGLWGWWLILGFLPNANLFATNSFLQDRYVYFGSIGLAVIVAPYLVANPLLLIMAVTFYTARTYMYSRHLQNDETLYRENWRNHPQSDYAVNNLSFFLIQQQRWEEARVIIQRGIGINPENKMLWYNLGVTWAATGNLHNDEGKFRFLKAIDCWKKALQIEPRWNKPAEDLQRMTKFLIDNKVLTVDKKDSAGGQTIDIPMMGKVEDGKAEKPQG